MKNYKEILRKTYKVEATSNEEALEDFIRESFEDLPFSELAEEDFFEDMYD